MRLWSCLFAVVVLGWGSKSDNRTVKAAYPEYVDGVGPNERDQLLVLGDILNCTIGIDREKARKLPTSFKFTM